MPDPIAWLFSLQQFGVKFGLENITRIVDALDRPDRSFRSVHIAGTNGKGSVAAMADEALRAAGHRVGRYTSPHLLDLTERFVVGGQPVAQDALAETVADVRDLVETLRRGGTLDAHPTFFEVTTAVAFELFRRAAVDVAVCEVGLGGRLDATNVLSPAVTAITSIGLDHQQYLGDTLREIAGEKAGIVKPGVPVVVGRMDPSAFEVIAAIARDRGAPLLQAALGPYAGARLALRGEHQLHNAAVAVTLLEALSRSGIAAPPPAVTRGLEHASWPGRLDVRRLTDGREALLDAAHNPDGAAALAAFLKTSAFQQAPLVFAVMRDKDIDGMLGALAPVVASFVVTRATNRRAADPEALAARVRAVAPGAKVLAVASPAEALAAAWRESSRIVVAGSIFLLGDVMKEAGWS